MIVTKRHVSAEIASASLFGIFLAISGPGGVAQAQTPMGSTATAAGYRSG